MGIWGAIKALFVGKTISKVKAAVNTPEGVEAVYESAIADAEERYEKSCSKLIEVAGKVISSEENLAALKKRLDTIEKHCRELVDAGRYEDATLYSSTKRKDIVKKIEVEESNLAGLKQLEEELKKINKKHASSLDELSTNKTRDLNAIYISNEVNDIYKELDPSRSRNDTDKLLQYAQTEVVQSAIDRTRGARQLYEGQEKTKVDIIEAEFEERDEYVENLIKAKKKENEDIPKLNSPKNK